MVGLPARHCKRLALSQPQEARLSPTFDRSLDCFADPASPTLPVHAVRPDALDASLSGPLAAHGAFLRAAGFAARPGQVMLLPGGTGLAGAVLGLGTERSHFAFGELPVRLPAEPAWRLEPGDFRPGDAALGVALGAYRAPGAPPQPVARMAHPAGVDDALSVARATWLVRDLINAPANHLGPRELAEAARGVAASFGVGATLVEGDELWREYPAVAAVGAGSERAPVVARFRWAGSGAGPDAPLIALCGKGVCFDTGGYDLKPASAMLRMKKDMGGAALMLGVARAIMAADLPVRLLVLLGCVENSISGHAMRPLDVLTTRRGLTVEVGNTDAEGRLVLCDLLAEASDEAPDLLLDAATLTGAARVALGPDLPALFSSDDGMANDLLAAGEAVSDPLWRLPLWDGYDGWLASPVADLNNVANKPFAGAVVAALFLRRFVRPGTKWAHIDTYAWNDSSRPARPEGGEALGLRAVLQMIRKSAGDAKIGH